MIDYPHHSSMYTNKSPCSVFVGDLSFFCQEVDLYQLFRPYGDILRVTIVRGKNERSRKSCFYGFVDYYLSQSAQRSIIALNGQLFLGRYIVVNSTETVAPKKNYRHWHKIAINYFAIGDRPVNEQCLRDIFAEFGSLPDVVVRDYYMQQNLHFQSLAYAVEAVGLAFLYFADAEGAMRAITAINDLKFASTSFRSNSSDTEYIPSLSLSRYNWIHFNLLDPDDPLLKEGDSLPLFRRTASSPHHGPNFFRHLPSSRSYHSSHQFYEHQGLPYAPHPPDHYRSKYPADCSLLFNQDSIPCTFPSPSYPDNCEIQYSLSTYFHDNIPAFPYQFGASASVNRNNISSPGGYQMSATDNSAFAENFPSRSSHPMDISSLSNSHKTHQLQPQAVTFDYFCSTSTPASGDIPVPREDREVPLGLQTSTPYLPNYRVEPFLPPLKEEEEAMYHSCDQLEVSQTPCDNMSVESTKVEMMDVNDTFQADDLLSLSTDVWLASISDSSSASVSTSFAVRNSPPAKDENSGKDIPSLASNISCSVSVKNTSSPSNQDSVVISAAQGKCRVVEITTNMEEDIDSSVVGSKNCSIIEN